ncbi:MAG: hypothetical protein RL654_1853 [Pseudomonadota bacterium]|jgi:hypothetical protein
MTARGALELLLNELGRLPGTRLVPVSTRALAPRAPAPASAEDARWTWYDTQPGEFAGLEITEYSVPAALCQAVFQTRDRAFQPPSHR